MRYRWQLPVTAAVASALAAASLHGLFRGHAWYGVMVLAAALATLIVAVGLRFGRAVRVFIPLVVFLGLAEFAVVGLASHRAPLGVLPDRPALRLLRSRLDHAVHEMQVLVVPVPAHAELIVVAAAGVWVAAALVAYWACTGRVGLAGIPLLALLVVPATVHNGHVGAGSFAFTAIGWLLLLAAETRGRREAESSGRRELLDRTSGEQPSTGAWRIAGVALASALLLPALVPALHHNLIDPGDGTGAGRGPGSVSIVPPLTTIEDELHERHPQTLLTVTTSTPSYLQLTALEDFTGQSFTLQGLSSNRSVSHGLSALTTSAPSQQVSVSVVASSDFAEHYLALPYAATSVRVSGDWLLDVPTRTVFSTTDTTSNLTYRAVSAVADPSTAELNAVAGPPDPGHAHPAKGELGVDTQVPGYLQPQLASVALAHTSGATNAFQDAVDLQNWLRGPAFRYSLLPQDYTGPDAILAFLDNGAGDCEQFSSTMVALLRSLGIPARVAVGFTPGSQVAPDTYRVTTADAHAWPQVYFPSLGWIRFEPTPGGQTGDDVPAYAQPTNQDGTGPKAPTHPRPGSSSAPSTRSSAKPGLLGHKRVPGADTGPAATAPVLHQRASSASPLGWILLGLLLAAAVSLAVPATLRQARRARRLTTSATGPGAAAARTEAWWQELLDSAYDLRLAVPASSTPRGTATRLAPMVGSGTAAATLTELAGCVEQLRYSAGGLVSGPLADRADLQTLRRALAASCPRVDRLRAGVFPPSVVDPLLGQLGLTSAGVLERADRVGARVRSASHRRLRRPAPGPL